jgi:HAD superfamily hydrolase (TIGR01450 family)
MDIEETGIYKRYQSLVGSYLPRDAEPSRKANRMDVEPPRVILSEILDKYDAFCFDGYGTLYNRGDFVYPGAMEWFRTLRAAGKHLRLVTNAASNTDDFLAKDAAARGFDFTGSETISSGSLLADLTRGKAVGVFDFAGFAGENYRPVDGLKRGETLDRTVREVYYIGRDTGVNVLAQAGIAAAENPIDPVVAVSSYTATDEMFNHSVEILRRPGALLLVLNPDAWAPKIDGTRSAVSGTLAERLRVASGCKTCYLGKPFPAIWDKVRESLPESARVLMIGDTIGTDVYGAKVAGFDSALVVGRNVPEESLASDEAALGVRPDYYLVPG